MVQAMTAEQRALILDIISQNEFADLGHRPPGRISPGDDRDLCQRRAHPLCRDMGEHAEGREHFDLQQGFRHDRKIRGGLGQDPALSLGGTAELVRDAGEMVRLYGLMAAKYPQTSDYPMPDIKSASVVIRIKPFVVSLIDYSKGFHHNELVSV